MKIGEAKQIYGGQIREYQEQKLLLSKQKRELEKKIEATENGRNRFADEAATLELTIDAVNKKQTEYQDYMSALTEQWAAKANMVSAEQQGEAMEEYVEDLGKIMEVARRIMKGGIVPASDEKKLMEYSMELYQSAKSIGAMVRNKDKEEYDSLWKDEEEKSYEDPMEVADNTEAFSDGPEIVDVADIMETTAYSSE
ncbi:MAG: hypothetical protein ACI4EP_00590 [Suilimivivens sp.]|nr:hypothetical protein [Lachnospiraceae bacterium]MDY5869227.1 hypothetical protein [Lachnospiraceae bacterium]